MENARLVTVQQSDTSDIEQSFLVLQPEGHGFNSLQSRSTTSVKSTLFGMT